MLDTIAGGIVLGITAAVAYDIYEDMKDVKHGKKPKQYSKNSNFAKDFDDYTKKLIWG
jgi:hypothetical protein